LLSMTIPLIDIPNTTAIPSLSLAPVILPMINVSPTLESQVSIPGFVWLLGGISCLLFIKMMIGFIHILSVYKRSIPDIFSEYRIRKVENLKNSFTFFQWIFIDLSHFERPEEIILHEQGHAKKLHSIDITFFHLLSILFWWMPTIWLMIKELKNIHEYEADAFALQSINQKTYTKTLVNSTLRAHGMNLASSFDDASIFNRLNFIKKMKKRINPWKVASIAALVAISGAMFACEDELDSEIKRIAAESNQNIEYSDEVTLALKKLQKENPNKEYIVVETLADNEESLKKLKEYDPEQIESIFVNTKEGQKSVTMIVSTESKIFKRTVEVQENEDEVFTIVEEAANFPGGMEAWGKYLKENMKYPEQAQRLGVQGRVFVQFIIEKDGSLSNFEVLKGIGAGCDNEALKMMKESPDWIPGEHEGVPVRQKMIQNILFKLS
jgi:TonB family protein